MKKTQSYDRTAVADANWQKMHSNTALPLADTDPEYASMMKKYIYGDIAQQVKITPVESALVKLSVLTTNQNEKMLRSAIQEGYPLADTRSDLPHHAVCRLCQDFCCIGNSE